MSGAGDGASLAELDDAALLQRHADAGAAGDAAAFAELVRRHRDRLWAVAVRTLGDREDAADALQDALLSAYRRAGSFRAEARVTTWLHRIVVNACLDRVRRAAVRPTTPLEPGSSDAGPGDGRLDPRAERAAATADPADAHAARLDVEAALATLPAEQRAALVLVDMQGWSVADAAVVLGCAEGTVKSRCARGRARLLPLLRHLAPGVDRVPAAEAIGGNAAAAADVPPGTGTGER